MPAEVVDLCSSSPLALPVSTTTKSSPSHHDDDDCDAFLPMPKKRKTSATTLQNLIPSTTQLTSFFEDDEADNHDFELPATVGTSNRRGSVPTTRQQEKSKFLSSDSLSFEDLESEPDEDETEKNSSLLIDTENQRPLSSLPRYISEFGSSPASHITSQNPRTTTTQTIHSDLVILTSSPRKDLDVCRLPGKQVDRVVKEPTKSKDPEDHESLEELLERIGNYSKLAESSSDDDAVIHVAEDRALRGNKGKKDDAHGTFADLTMSDLSSSEDDKPVRKAKATRAKSRNSASDAKVKAREREENKKRKAREREEAKQKKQQEREEARKKKQMEREAAKQKKQQEKEEKSREKERAAAIADVNRSKISKKVTVAEMIVDLADSFKDTALGKQIEAFMEKLNVETCYFDSEIPNIIKWRRNVRAVFNERLGIWEPVEIHVEEESHILVYITAKGFVDLAGSNGPSNLSTFISKVSAAFPDTTPIYLIEGLHALLRKNDNARNRAFQSAVRAQDDARTAPARRRKRADEHACVLSNSAIEEALLDLQLDHSVLVYHTTVAVASAEWISNFTQSLSTRPYRLVRTAHDTSLGFCMDSGQIQCGDSAEEIFQKMLQEIVRVTPAISRAVVNEVGTVDQLVKGFEGPRGNAFLENMRKLSNKDGSVTDGRVGSSISRRIWNIFMEDEGCLDT